MRKILILVGIGIFLSGCATVYNPATGKQDQVSTIVTPQVEAMLGAYFYVQTCQNYQGRVYEDQRLSAIGRNIVSISDRGRDFNYRFFVVDDYRPNAFTASGGYVYVTKGLMEMASDEEIACVMAHELGHDACRHMAKKLPAIIGIQVFISAASKKEKNKNVQQVVSVMYQIVANGYSRQDEREADKLAIRYAYNAGYDPRKYITFFEKLQSKSSQVYIPLIATHPQISERIANAKEEISCLNLEQFCKEVPRTALSTSVHKLAFSVKDEKDGMSKKASPINYSQDLAQYSYKIGYQHGFKSGYSRGIYFPEKQINETFQNIDEYWYKRGYDDGWKAGFQEGLKR